MEIVKDLVHPTMYRIKWSDGVLSADFYNKTRAKEHLSKIQAEMGSSIQSTMPLRASRKPVGAFK